MVVLRIVVIEDWRVRYLRLSSEQSMSSAFFFQLLTYYFQDSKHLFMLEESDLQVLGVTSPIVQTRILQEISQLKLERAKGLLFFSIFLFYLFIFCLVPAKQDLYRFSVLRDILLPTASDQLNKFNCVYYKHNQQTKAKFILLQFTRNWHI